jgi:hypothetical protein
MRDGDQGLKNPWYNHSTPSLRSIDAAERQQYAPFDHPSYLPPSGLYRPRPCSCIDTLPALQCSQRTHTTFKTIRDAHVHSLTPPSCRGIHRLAKDLLLQLHPGKTPTYPLNMYISRRDRRIEYTVSDL